jgi:hypothetical protein
MPTKIIMASSTTNTTAAKRSKKVSHPSSSAHTADTMLLKLRTLLLQLSNLNRATRQLAKPRTVDTQHPTLQDRRNSLAKEARPSNRTQLSRRDKAANMDMAVTLTIKAHTMRLI